MKNYISKATLALLVALSATGCSDFLDEKLKSELAPDNTYTSSYGFEVGSTGLYAEARSEYNTWGENGAFMHNAACPYEALQIATDTPAGSSSCPAAWPCCWWTPSVSSPVCPTIWWRPSNPRWRKPHGLMSSCGWRTRATTSGKNSWPLLMRSWTGLTVPTSPV